MREETLLNQGRLGLLPFCKEPPDGHQGQDNSEIRRRNQGGRSRDTETQRDPRQANPPGVDRELGAVRGWKGGGKPAQETAADVGTRHRAQ